MEPASTEPPPLVTAYLATLEAKTPATIDAYRRVLRQFCAWLSERPGCGDGFAPRAVHPHRPADPQAYLPLLQR